MQFLPDELIVIILRSDKCLFHASRIVSKSIRNGSLSDILQHEIHYPLISNEIATLSQPFCFVEEYGSIDNDDCQMTDIYIIPRTLLLDKIQAIFYYKLWSYSDSYMDYYDNEVPNLFQFSIISNETWMLLRLNTKPKLDIDFINYYYIILQRLQYYDCNRKSLARSLVLKKFDGLCENRDYFSLLLLSTMIILGITVTNDLGQVITLSKDVIRNKILELK